MLRTIIKILSGRQPKDDLHMVDKHLAESFERNEWTDTKEASENIKSRISNSVLNKTINPSRKSKNKYRIALRAAAAITLFGILGYYAFKLDHTNDILVKNQPSFASSKSGLNTSTGIYKDIKFMKIGEVYSTPSFLIKRDSEQLFRVVSNHNSQNLTDIKISTATNESYQIELSDHSKVTLDANSELIFPSKFENNNRQLTATGNLYFEVAKDKVRPFSVKSEHMNALVKGTSFVFNTVDQNENSFIALIEGSLEMETKDSRILLKPGQKGIYKNNNLAVDSFDSEEMVAFTRNEFLFVKQPIKIVLAEIAHWYKMDLDLSEIDLNEHKLTLKINRSKPLKEVLDILELTGDLKININERRISVKKNNN